MLARARTKPQAPPPARVRPRTKPQAPPPTLERARMKPKAPLTAQNTVIEPNNHQQRPHRFHPTDQHPAPNETASTTASARTRPHETADATDNTEHTASIRLASRGEMVLSAPYQAYLPADRKLRSASCFTRVSRPSIDNLTHATHHCPAHDARTRNTRCTCPARGVRARREEWRYGR